MKTAGIILACIVGIVLLSAIGSALNLITIPWLQFDSKVQTNRDIVTSTYNAQNALYNYHWFQEQAGEIKTADQNIEVASSSLASFETNAGARSTWDFQDKTEDSRLRSVLQGNIAYYNGLVNNYNARAGEADRSIFQNGLPLFFNLQ
jgi:hypothetical protein